MIARNEHLPRSDDTRVDQFLDLSAHDGILHVILQSARVALRLLQDLLHDGVVHDTLKFIRGQ